MPEFPSLVLIDAAGSPHYYTEYFY